MIGRDGLSDNDKQQKKRENTMNVLHEEASKLYAKKPYKKAYGDIWDDVHDLNGLVTKSELVKRMKDRTGKSDAACTASVGIILSPRETSKGDCRGNVSAKGHLYYFEKLKREVNEDGVREERRYRFSWRTEILSQKKRTEAGEDIESIKTMVSETDVSEADAVDAVEMEAV